MDELLRDFLTETSESLASIDNDLVAFEQTPDNPELIRSIFRMVHTIKGTCGFIGLNRLGSVAHSAENVLGLFRDGELPASAENIGAVLEAIDVIKLILAGIEQSGGTEPQGDDSDLVRRLDAIVDGSAAAPAAAQPAGEAAEMPEAVVVEAHPAPVEAAVIAAPVVAASNAEAPAANAAHQTIRVSVALLETLMTGVSELVLTRNQLLQSFRALGDGVAQVPVQRLTQIVSELQEGVMKTRMQPIGNAWQNLPRLIRDLAHDLGKKIELDLTGADTEVDRQVLEIIKDPLTHMVRNSADHGLELPAERLAAGKAETGRIKLSACHQGGHILIKIADDGRGLNTARIRQKIVEKGLLPAAQAAELSDTAVHRYVFDAGFSTAEKVTAVSGRGVGMDVVRSNIEKSGGTVDLSSVEGKGTCFTIRIPLTLAIASALIVETCGERFAVPQISVLELVQVSPTSEHKIETINAAPLLRLRERLLPLIYLGSALGLGDTAPEAQAYVLVLQANNHTFGVVVDRVLGTEEIVVKPVSPILKGMALYAGNTILGDGSVVMILDPNGILATAGTISDDASTAEANAGSGTHENDKVALLVFQSGSGTPKAVPLSLIARLEEVDTTKIEIGDGRPVIQYRGKLMPLIGLEGAQDVRSEGRQPLLVFSDGLRNMGLLVTEIVDIVEERLAVEMTAKRPGFLGTAIVAGKSTDVIDAGYYVTQAYPDWFAALDRRESDRPANAPKRVLLVDDSPFFRNLLAPLLSTAGFEVTAADSADQALTLCDAGREFDVIVSDIEMPGTDGFEFAQAVRKGTRWQHLPMVALTSRTAPADLERGRAVGFTDYIAKLDRDALLRTLSETTATRGAA